MVLPLFSEPLVPILDQACQPLKPLDRLLHLLLVVLRNLQSRSVWDARCVNKVSITLTKRSTAIIPAMTPLAMGMPSTPAAAIGSVASRRSTARPAHFLDASCSTWYLNRPTVSAASWTC